MNKKISRDGLMKYSRILILAVLFLFFALSAKTFAQWSNIKNIIFQQVPFLMVLSIMIVLTNGLLQLGVSSYWQQAAIGFVIVLSIIFERIIKRPTQGK